MADVSDLNSLMASISRWELAEYVSLFAVIVGVIGESVHELTSWFKGNSWWKQHGGKAAALFLIVALAAEVVTTINANSANGLAIAFLGEQEADTRLRAAEIERKYAWRTITPVQRKKLLDTLSGYTFPICVEYSRADPEAFEYANQFFDALSSTSLKIVLSDIVPFIPTRGVKIIGPSPDKEKIAKALTEAGIPFYEHDEQTVGHDCRPVALSIGGKLPPA